MKKNVLFKAFALFFWLLIFTSTSLGQVTIQYFNFNENRPGSSTNWAQPIAAQIGGGQITYTFTEAWDFTGTTLNGEAGEVNGGSFCPRGGASNENNGRHFIITLPTTGYENIVLSYATQRTNTGFTSQQILYSLNGTDFTDFITITDIPAAFAVRTVDFSGISGVNDNANFTVKIILDGISSSAGNNRFDNIALRGTEIGAAPQVAAPTFSPPGGDFALPIEVSIATSTADATVLYSMVGDEGPWTTFSAPISVSESTTIWAYAEKTDYDDSSVVSATYNFPEPATTTIPYNETFDDDLGDCYVYSVLGSTKFWVYASFEANGYAMMNGHNSGEIEEDWLILPGLNLDNYNSEQLTFDTWYNFGTDDDNNYLKLMYSTNYAGVGNPTSATWTELIFVRPTTAQNWVSSGPVDLSAISGTSVWIAFKYRYEPGKYRAWQVDNISIIEATEPIFAVNPVAISGFDYVVGEGPSVSKSFQLNGSNLDGTHVQIFAPTNFQVSYEQNGTYQDGIGLPAYDGNPTNIWVRMKAGLPVGSYSGNVEIVGGGAQNKMVALSGEVFAPPAAAISINAAQFTYTQDFNSLAKSGIKNPWSDGDIVGWMWQCGNFDRDPNNPDNGYGASFGGSNFVEGHSFGLENDNDRAMGAISGASNRNFFIGVKFKNETSQPIALSDILVSYAGEQWRQTANSQPLVFSYKISPINFADIKVGDWTPNTNLDFATLHTTTGEAGPLNGNLPENRTLFTNVPLNSSSGGALQPGEFLFLRWYKTGSTSPGLGIDDFVLRIPKENTSVEEINQPVFKIFPNPTIADINVEGQTNIQRIRVTNMLGQQVVELNNLDSDRVTIQTSTLKTGYYIISITDVNGYTFNTRFIKR